jgi:hypothetical protein
MVIGWEILLTQETKQYFHIKNQGRVSLVTELSEKFPDALITPCEEQGPQL